MRKSCVESKMDVQKVGKRAKTNGKGRREYGRWGGGANKWRREVEGKTLLPSTFSFLYFPSSLCFILPPHLFAIAPTFMHRSLRERLQYNLMNLAHVCLQKKVWSPTTPPPPFFFLCPVPHWMIIKMFKEKKKSATGL